MSIEWHSDGNLKDFANIFLLKKYDGRKLYDVSLYLGECKFDSKGEEVKAPLLTTSLKVREFKDKPMFRSLTPKKYQK